MTIYGWFRLIIEVAACLVWLWVFLVIRKQQKLISEYQRIINQQNQRQVGFLAIFQMLLEKLQEQMSRK